MLRSVLRMKGVCIHHKRIVGDGVSEGRDAGGTEAASPSLALSPTIRCGNEESGIFQKGLNPTKERLGGQTFFELCCSDFNEGKERCLQIANRVDTLGHNLRNLELRKKVLLKDGLRLRGLASAR